MDAARLGRAALAGHAQDREIGEQRDALGDLLAGRDVGLLGRAATVGGRVVLVVDERLAVAQRAHVVGEAAPGRVEVEVAHVGVARIAKAVDDVRRHPGEVARRHAHLLVLDAQPHGQLTLEDVEEVRVVLVHMQARALHPGAKRDSVACTGSRSDRISTRRPGLSPTTPPPPGGITVRPIGRRVNGVATPAFDGVSRERDRAFVGTARRGPVAGLAQELRARRVEGLVAVQGAAQRRERGQAGLGLSANPIAAARLSSTTGVGSSSASAP